MISNVHLPTLSPSSIRLWESDKALFILKHVYHTRGEGSNIYAIRGIAVESGINKNVLECPQRVDTSVALPEVLAVYDKLVHEHKISQDISREFKPTLTSFLTNGLIELSNIFEGFKDVSSQVGIGFQFMGFNIHGYIDYLKGDRLVDLKCTNKLPTIVTRGPRKGRLIAYKSNDVLQVCLYKLAIGLEPILLYTSSEGTLVYEVSGEEFAEVSKKIVDILADIKYTLELPHDEMLRITQPVRMDGFLWDSDLTSAARHIWSL